MRSFITIVCLVLIFPGVLSAAKLQLEVPDGLSEVYLLSEGTPSILNHLKTRFDQDIENLAKKYQIDVLKKQADKATILAQEKNEDYAERFNSLRNTYLKSVSLHIVGVETEISPSSSALAEVLFHFSIKNNSDRII
ncbi:MAG TPA: hypothetical protein ENN05_02440, partial [Deltaproteobacteria bacterium]|nr:hypothetical protein [Deltaproteobacteria bacterium]